MPPRNRSLQQVSQHGGGIGQFSISKTELYRSPYPIPAVIDALERNYPGATAIVLQNVRAAQEHVHAMQHKDLDYTFEIAKVQQKLDGRTVTIGQFIGLAIVLASIAAYVILALNGYPVWGLISFLVGIAGVIGITLYGRYQQVRFNDKGIEAGALEQDTGGQDSADNSK